MRIWHWCYVSEEENERADILWYQSLSRTSSEASSFCYHFGPLLFYNIQRSKIATIYLFSCFSRFAFDPTLQKCDYPVKVNCTSRPLLRKSLHCHILTLLGPAYLSGGHNVPPPLPLIGLTIIQQCWFNALYKSRQHWGEGQILFCGFELYGGRGQTLLQSRYSFFFLLLGRPSKTT